MEMHKRCPWCGVDLKTHKGKLSFFHRGRVRYCSQCGFAYIKKMTLLGFFLIGLACATYKLYCEESVYFIIFFLHIILLILYDFKLPYVKYEEQKKTLYNRSYLMHSAQVTIQWIHFKEGGILCPKIRIWNDYIFPICFVGKDEIPISQMICVRFTKINIFRKDITAKIEYVDNNNPKALFQRGNKFYIFSNKKVIGVGYIVS